MELKIRHFCTRIIISVALCLWGIHTIKMYNINLIQSIREQVDGYQQLISIMNASNDFLEVLINKYNFIKPVNQDEKIEIFWIFTLISIVMQTYISKIYDYYLNYKTNDYLGLINVISFITNFFLMFVANDIILILFDTIYEHRPFVTKVISKFFDFLESPYTFVVLLIIPLLILLKNIIAGLFCILYIPVFLSWAEMSVICIVYIIIIILKLNIPVFLSIIITISIRAAFKYISTYIWEI